MGTMGWLSHTCAVVAVVVSASPISYWSRTVDTALIGWPILSEGLPSCCSTSCRRYRLKPCLFWLCYLMRLGPNRYKSVKAMVSVIVFSPPIIIPCARSIYASDVVEACSQRIVCAVRVPLLNTFCCSKGAKVPKLPAL